MVVGNVNFEVGECYYDVTTDVLTSSMMYSEQLFNIPRPLSEEDYMILLKS